MIIYTFFIYQVLVYINLNWNYKILCHRNITLKGGSNIQVINDFYLL